VTAAPPARDFASDIAVRPGGDGRWLADLSPRWDVARGPNGGYVAAVVLQAMLAQLDDAERAPRSLTLHYLRPPSIGPCEITVTVQRSGRGMSTLTARLSQDAKVTILAIGAFAADYPGAATYAVAAPAVGPPEDPVLVRFTSRTASGGFFEEDGEVWAPDGTLLAQSRQLALLLAPPPA
jgi:acyl-CoA thioesterase